MLCFHMGYKHHWLEFKSFLFSSSLLSAPLLSSLLLPSPLLSIYSLYSTPIPPLLLPPLPSPSLHIFSLCLSLTPFPFFLPLIIYLPKFFSELKHELKTELLCLFVINTSL